MNSSRKTFIALATASGLSVGYFFGPAFADKMDGKAPADQVRQARAALVDVRDFQEALRAIDKAVEPSVVSIEVKSRASLQRSPQDEDMRRRFFGDRMPEMPEQSPGQMQFSRGSGVIIKVDGDTGYIVTNHHVAGSSEEMRVALADGTVITDVKLVGTDPKTDLAVIRIKGKDLVAAEWADSAELQKGDIVVAFGSPLGFTGSMTQGIVSALDRDTGILTHENDFAYEQFIQTDAAINPGNSGGPLVDIRGKVVGINSSIASRTGLYSGIGFAVPSKQAKYVVNQLIGEGRVARGWLGVQIADAKAYEDRLNFTLPDNGGVLINGVFHNTPAYDKLKPLDVVTKLNGKTISSVNDLRGQIASTPPQETVTLTVLREGKGTDVKIKLGEQPDSRDAQAMANADEPTQQSQDVGVELRSAEPNLLQQFDLPQDTAGVLVTRVRSDSPAAAAGIRPGDVITRVGKQNVADPATALKALEEASGSEKPAIVLLINRDGERFVTLGNDTN